MQIDSGASPTAWDTAPLGSSSSNTSSFRTCRVGGGGGFSDSLCQPDGRQITKNSQNMHRSTRKGGGGFNPSPPSGNSPHAPYWGRMSNGGLSPSFRGGGGGFNPSPRGGNSSNTPYSGRMGPGGLSSGGGGGSRGGGGESGSSSDGGLSRLCGGGGGGFMDQPNSGRGCGGYWVGGEGGQNSR